MHKSPFIILSLVSLKKVRLREYAFLTLRPVEGCLSYAKSDVCFPNDHPIGQQNLTFGYIAATRILSKVLFRDATAHCYLAPRSMTHVVTLRRC